MLTLQDIESLIDKMKQTRPIAQLPPMYVSEFGMLVFEIGWMKPTPIHTISSWYLPKRTRKILAEGRIGRKESGLRLLIYRSAWVSETGTVQFIGSGPEYGLVDREGKKFRYELYQGTRLLRQTNSLNEVLNHLIEQP